MCWLLFNTPGIPRGKRKHLKQSKQLCLFNLWLMTVCVPRSNRVPGILALMQRPQPYCCAWGKFSLCKRNCRIAKAVTWPGVFLLKIFALLWYNGSDLPGVGNAEIPTPSVPAAGAHVPSQPLNSGGGRMRGSVPSSATLQCPGKPELQKILSEKIISSQTRTKWKPNSLYVQWFHFRSVGSWFLFTSLPLGMQGRGSYCTACFILKN